MKGLRPFEKEDRTPHLLNEAAAQLGALHLAAAELAEAVLAQNRNEAEDLCQGLCGRAGFLAKAERSEALWSSALPQPIRSLSFSQPALPCGRSLDRKFSQLSVPVLSAASVSFLETPRREAVDAVATGVQQTESARKLLDVASAEDRGVMLSASYSLAAYEKLFENLPKHAEVSGFCPFCKCAVVPS